MTAGLVFGTLFGLGAITLLTAQRHGAPQSSIATRLAALDPSTEVQSARPRERVFRTDVFEQLLRPHIEHAGEVVARATGRVGLDFKATDDRLRLTGDRGGLALFLGQKLASGLFAFAILPAAATVGGPRTPLFFWIAGGAAGFLMPDIVLRGRAQVARRRIRDELVRFTELLTLAVSAGLGLEGALEQIAQTTDGPLFRITNRLLRDAQIRGEPAAAALMHLADEVGLPEIEPLATAVRTAAAQGTPITQALRAQARAIREKRRLELIEAGERAQVRMLLPVGLLILPAFFVVVLYPAAVQLLRVTSR